MAVLEHMRILLEECWHTVWIRHVKLVVLDLVVGLGCEGKLRLRSVSDVVVV